MKAEWTKSLYNGEAAIDQVLDVIYLMKQFGLKHSTSMSIVAYFRKVRAETIRDKCYRGLGINQAKFIELLSNGEIKQHLFTKYPQYTDKIIELFNQIKFINPPSD